jgi:hypothetical protein
MEFKTRTTFKKRVAALLLALSIAFGGLYQPLTAPKAEAIFGVGDINLESIPIIVKILLDAIAPVLAQRLIDGIVNETVRWASEGFEGGPAYTTDSKAFILNTADGVIGEFIAGKDGLSGLCSPFRSNVILSIRHQYSSGKESYSRNQFQCKLTDVIGNIDNFFDGNFASGGGWRTWFSVSQNSTSNPYGAYIEGQIELDSRIAGIVGVDREKLAWSQGFKDLANCLERNPSAQAIQEYVDGTYTDGSPGDRIAKRQDRWDESKGPGECIREGPVTVAGNTIKSQLDQVLPSGLNKLITVQSIEQLLGAFASGVLQRYVFSNNRSSGIFASDSAYSFERREMLDVDGDGIPDGWDTTGNGQLDICHHGFKDTSKGPSNDNCIKSNEPEARGTTYFAQLCESLEDTTATLKSFLAFLERNSWNGDYSSVWLNRMSTANGSVGALINTLRRHEVAAFDKAMFTLSWYEKWLGAIIENVARGRGIGHKRARSDDNEGKRQEMIRNTRGLIAYLATFKSRIVSCNNPNTTNLDTIPDAGFIDDDVKEQPPLPPTPPEIASCSASPTNTQIDKKVTWTATTSLTSPTFTWAGDEIEGLFGQIAMVAYQSLGTKSASVMVWGVDEDEVTQIYLAICSNTVEVTTGAEPPVENPL